MPLPKPNVSNAQVEVLTEEKFSLGEGPHWEEKTQRLIWIDIFGPSVNIYDPATKENKVYNIREQLEKLGAKGNRLSVGVAVPIVGEPDKLVIGTGSHVATFDPTTGEVEFKNEFQDGKDDTRYNDGKCDPSGRFWVGSMGVEVNAMVDDLEAGNLYLVDKGFAAPKHEVGKIAISNGLAWSADKKTMYYIDSIPGAIYAFDYDDTTGCISNKRTLVDTTKLDVGAPDGMTIDTLGRLWVAGYLSSAVHCFDPTCPSEPPVSVPIPGARCITSCCFGGKNLDELYVTSARKDDLDGENAGKLFRVTGIDATGTLSQCYAG